MSVPEEFGAAQRTVSDVLDPYRPGSATATVNATTLALGLDTAGWSWVRLVTLAAGLEGQADVQG